MSRRSRMLERPYFEIEDPESMELSLGDAGDADHNADGTGGDVEGGGSE
jgi:hypothetical protein